MDLKPGQYVIVKGTFEGDPNHKVKVNGINSKQKEVWVSNVNMPFLGNISKIVPFSNFEKIGDEYYVSIR